MSRETRRRTLDALKALNEAEAAQFGDPETLTRIAQYELAYRMQIAVPEVLDIAQGSRRRCCECTARSRARRRFANNCLLARRLVEQGVRFVQLFDWGWDIHGTGDGDDLINGFPKKCQQVDQAMRRAGAGSEAARPARPTLVVWGGEFGRTPMNEARGGSTFLGRDHHPHAFTHVDGRRRREAGHRLRRDR